VALQRKKGMMRVHGRTSGREKRAPARAFVRSQT
jgi:hypothetical protein